MDNCIFCKIIRHEIPSYCLYENDDVIAFLDVNPTSYGHCLVVCKKHYKNITECDKKTLDAMIEAVQAISKALLKTYACGLNVLSNINEVAGQSVMHAHIHLIPVNKDGNKANIQFNELKDVPLKEIYDNIIKNI